MNKYTTPVLFLYLVFIFSCTKQVVEVREVTVGKKYSWGEVKYFTGIDKVFLSSGSSATAIYLQQPYNFTALTNISVYDGIQTHAAGLPTDVDIRLPISSEYCPLPYNDTMLKIMNNRYPTISPSGGYFNLKKIDPTLTYVLKYYNVMFKAMSINKNGTLLLAYVNNRPVNTFTFMLLKIKTYADYPYADTIATKTIDIPRLHFEAYVRHIAAVSDYFLLDLSDEGLYKIKEDGSASKVHAPAVVDAFYEWHGKVYAHAEWDKLFISSDNGDNWQDYGGINSTMVSSQYHQIKDSLVGVYRDNIFTLKWNNGNYTQRFLKNDGVEGTRINGIEILRDSVYVATTSGLFVKPINTFFESK